MPGRRRGVARRRGARRVQLGRLVLDGLGAVECAEDALQPTWIVEVGHGRGASGGLGARAHSSASAAPRRWWGRPLSARARPDVPGRARIPSGRGSMRRPSDHRGASATETVAAMTQAPAQDVPIDADFHGQSMVSSLATPQPTSPSRRSARRKDAGGSRPGAQRCVGASTATTNSDPVVNGRRSQVASFRSQRRPTASTSEKKSSKE